MNSAKPLFSQTKITGSSHSAARLIDSLKIPAWTAPSPKNTTATWSPSRSRAASALPSAIGMLPPTTPVAPSSPCSTSTRCMDPPSPLQRPSARPISSAIARSSGAPAAIACPWARWPL